MGLYWVKVQPLPPPPPISRECFWIAEGWRMAFHFDWTTCFSNPFNRTESALIEKKMLFLFFQVRRAFTFLGWCHIIGATEHTACKFLAVFPIWLQLRLKFFRVFIGPWFCPSLPKTTSFSTDGKSFKTLIIFNHTVVQYSLSFSGLPITSHWRGAACPITRGCGKFRELQQRPLLALFIYWLSDWFIKEISISEPR